MNLLQLRYFIKLAEDNGHLTKTAEELYVSAPSLSATLKRLENDIGCSLFTRSHKKLELNENGRIFYEYTSRALREIENGINVLSKNKKNRIQIAMGSPYYWIDFILNFEKTYPRLVVAQCNYEFSQLNSSLPQNFDLYLGALRDLDPHLYHMIPFDQNEYPVILISKKHPLSQKTTLSLSDLVSVNCLDIGQHNPSAYKYAEDLFKIQKVKKKNFIEVDYFSRFNLLVRNKGYVISTNKGYGAVANNDPTIAAVPLAPPIIYRKQCCAWRKEHPLRQSELDFLKFFITYYDIHYEFCFDHSD